MSHISALHSHIDNVFACQGPCLLENIVAIGGIEVPAGVLNPFGLGKGDSENDDDL